MATRQRRALAGALVLASLFPLVALLAPAMPFDPEEVNLEARLSPPDAVHWMGTDELGRDVLSRTLHGTRVSLAAGLIAAGLSLLLGALLGAAAGFTGGRTDRAVLYLVDVVQAFPALVLVAVGAAFLTQSFLTAALLIAATGWTSAARLVRAEARRVVPLPFVEAARAAGASRLRILLRHVLPHALPPALATAPYVLGAAVLTEASLSFLGLGTPPPTPSWGRALADARSTLTEAWWCVLPPAVGLLLMVLAARHLGDLLARRRLESTPL